MINISPSELGAQMAEYLNSLEQKITDLENEIALLSPQNGFDLLPDILTAKDVAKYLSLKGNGTYELFKISPKHGGIKSFKLTDDGRSVRCTKEDFKAYLERRMNDDSSRQNP